MNYLLRFAAAITLAFPGSAALAQGLPCPPPVNNVTVNAGNDTTICPNQCATLNGSGIATSMQPQTTSYNVDSPAYTPYPFYAGTAVSITQDDTYGPLLQLPFPFCFYGVKYTQCVIGANGQISFNPAVANAYCPWAINGGIPGLNATAGAATLNAIMGPFYDMYPPAGGTIKYITYGTAPCRVFVVSWDSIPMFSCTSLKGSQQIVLHESTFQIDVFVRDKPTCAWNSNRSVLGVQNAAGTAFTVAPGYNGTAFEMFNKAYRFTPSGPSGGPTGSSFNWFTLAGTPVGGGATISVCPPVTTDYVLRAEFYSGCDTLRKNDTMRVNIGGGPVISDIAFTDPTTCGGSDGTITLTINDTLTQVTVTYRRNNVWQTSVSAVSSATGTVLLPNLKAGTYDSITVFKGLCFSLPGGPVVLTDPPLDADYSYDILYGCAGDTVLFTNLSATPGPMTYQWQFGDGGSDTATNPAHVYLTQNIFNAKLIATNGFCADSITKPIDLLHPLDAMFTVDRDSVCEGGLITFTNTSITTTRNNISPTYLWDFGDGNTSTLQSPTHFYSAPGVYKVTMHVTDFVPCTDSATHTIVVDSLPYISFTVSDSVLCEGQSVTFTGDYLPNGNTGIRWDFSDGTYIVNKNPVSHSFDSAGLFTIKFSATYRICPDTSFTKEIMLKPYPQLDLGPDTTICPNGEPIMLRDILAGVTPGSTYLWNTNETAPGIMIRHQGVYAATKTFDGCSVSDSIEVFKNCYLDIPNSFTPNGDGMNDYFLPRQLLSSGAVSFKMTIFNRWGQVIFETTSLDGRGWDGKFNDKDQPQGVYVYLIDASFINGSQEHYQGNVTLLR